MTNEEEKEVEEVEAAIQQEPLWLFVLEMFWWMFKQAVLAAGFLYLGYSFGYRDGWNDLAAEIRVILKLQQPQKQIEKTDESI